MDRALRVIHCGTGTAGSLALQALIDEPAFELMGLLVHGADKHGRDAGELAERPATGVRTSTDLAQLLALEADCVCYMMLVPEPEHIVAFLESGKNVVTTAGLMYPHLVSESLGQRIEEACRCGDTSLYVTGINPGWVDESLPLALSQMSRRIDRVLIQEYADCGQYPAPHIISVMGFGKTPEQVEAEADNLAIMRTFFQQSVAALAADLGCPADEVTESREFVLAQSDYDIKAGHIARGTVAGQRWRWVGLVDGVERVVQETYWFTAFDLGEDYPREGELSDDTLWRVTLEGEPSLRCTFEPRQSFADNAGSDGENPSALATAMMAVNSLSAVCAARTGLLGPADLRGRDMPSRLGHASPVRTGAVSP